MRVPAAGATQRYLDDLTGVLRYLDDLDVSSGGATQPQARERS